MSIGWKLMKIEWLQKTFFISPHCRYCSNEMIFKIETIDSSLSFQRYNSIFVNRNRWWETMILTNWRLKSMSCSHFTVINHKFGKIPGFWHAMFRQPEGVLKENVSKNKTGFFGKTPEFSQNMISVLFSFCWNFESYRRR